ncbi:hypothetical protein O6H91_20G068100 [Diphasiastrum complanatum]|uniref:Uncharacterized protein n=3 Tax=Diphasiastrum complanatum TaxID=34168 RepID=A0ACC2ARP2_DIPCM|nr:hypothetical protein O6H91_20G068100 [Diphasiastrum complanatum]
MGVEEAAEIVGCLRASFRSGHTKPRAWRVQQLEAVLMLLQDREKEIQQAVYSDLAKPPYETFTGEVALVENACKLAVKKLKEWMSPEKVSTSFALYPSSAEIVPEPLGVVLVIAAWNFPFLLAMDPLVGAVAAGNAVVLKPSELAPATSNLLARLIPFYLDNSAVCVVEGGVSETSALLDQKWDKIFYTGSSRVAKLVMAAASKHLTPVTLELGGKCPAIIDSSADLRVACRRIAVGKWGNNNGQACISPDYILADESIVHKLIETLTSTLKEFYGEDPRASPDLARIVNFSHFTRLTKLLDHPSTESTIVHGGQRDEKNLYIAPTILLNVPCDAPIMKEEIFGPLLPILTVKTVDEAVNFVTARPKPLALYVFTKRKSVKDVVLRDTSAGGMVVNDTMLHFVVLDLPFGGVGESGMGAYHGKHSFDNFSHRKAVLRRSFFADILARYPPYSSLKQRLVRCLLKADYFGIILVMLGLKR